MGHREVHPGPTHVLPQQAASVSMRVMDNGDGSDDGDTDDV